MTGDQVARAARARRGSTTAASPRRPGSTAARSKAAAPKNAGSDATTPTVASPAPGDAGPVARTERSPSEVPPPDRDPRPLSIFLLRHADAGDPAAWTGEDAERPLTRKGRRQAQRLGRHLDALGVEVDALLTSPKLRAADTARLVGKALRRKPAVEPRLAGGFDLAALGELANALDATASSVLLVGHDPDFSAVASLLTDAPIELRKGALARIDLPDRTVAADAGALRWLLPPDAVPK